MIPVALQGVLSVLMKDNQDGLNWEASVSQDAEEELYAIQRLQFTDAGQASQRLLVHIRQSLPFKVDSLAIIPRAVSLNSISGRIVSEGGQQFFFKTHVEPDSILAEYYNVALLERAGYPILKPIFFSQKPGQQIVVYPYLSSRTLFELAYEAEHNGGETQHVLRAQVNSDKRLLQIYSDSFRESQEMAESPVHQLFYYRLCGPRFEEFYKDASFLVDGHELSFRNLASYTWTVNGVEYVQTLGELIDSARRLLQPDSHWGGNIVGHGDAHNGNLFYDESSKDLIYFDPAFAGTHSPFIDLIKPLFHNVFATWMYHPAEVSTDLDLTCRIVGKSIEISHNYQPSALRQDLLESKLKHVLLPLLSGHIPKYLLPKDWAFRMRAALLCCPLLTVNLSDRERYPDSIALLGLSQCVEAGSMSRNGAGPFDRLPK